MVFPTVFSTFLIFHKNGDVDVIGGWDETNVNKPKKIAVNAADAFVIRDQIYVLMKNGDLVDVINNGVTIDTDVSKINLEGSPYINCIMYIKKDGTLCVGYREYDFDPETYVSTFKRYETFVVDSDVASAYYTGDVQWGASYWSDPAFYLKENGSLYMLTMEDEPGAIETKFIMDNVKSFICANAAWYGDNLLNMFALTKDDKLYSWSKYICGSEDEAEDMCWDVLGASLGFDEGTPMVKSPKLAASGVKAVYSNAIGTYILKNDGRLRGCGVVIKGSYKGGIGNGTYDYVYGFKKIISDVDSMYQLTYRTSDEDESPEPIYYHATTRYAVKSDGSVWAWGSGENGFIGNGSTKRQDSPVKIMDPKYAK
jgi:hypothetical protein